MFSGVKVFLGSGGGVRFLFVSQGSRYRMGLDYIYLESTINQCLPIEKLKLMKVGPTLMIEGHWAAKKNNFSQTFKPLFNWPRWESPTDSFRRGLRNQPITNEQNICHVRQTKA